MDLYTTFLELADVEVPKDRVVDGVSLVPALLNSTSTDRYMFHRLIRTKKLVMATQSANQLCQKTHIYCRVPPTRGLQDTVA